MSRRLLIIISVVSVALTGIGFYMDTDVPAGNALVTCTEFMLLTMIVFGILVLLYQVWVFVRYLFGRFFSFGKAGN